MEPLDRPKFSFSEAGFAGTTQIHLILEHEESGPAGLLDSSTMPQPQPAFRV
jgi:hypothetical protein